MGVRKTTDFLEKATWSLAGTIIVLSIVAAAFLPSRNIGENSEIKDAVQQELPVNTTPGFGAQQKQEAPATPAAETPKKEESTTPAN